MTQKQNKTKQKTRVIQAAHHDPITRDVWHHVPQYQHADPRTCIARHYHYAVTRAFERETRTHILLFEDDLRVSPDALEYLLASLPHLKSARNNSVVCASVWNDNGRAPQPKNITLTSFFPGLGWVLSRHLWNVIGRQWPGSMNPESDIVATGWDFWLRVQFAAHGWLCATPTTPRVRHVGVGINVGATQRDAQYSRNRMEDAVPGKFDWPSELAAVVKVNDFARIVQHRLSRGRLVRSVEDAVKHAAHKPVLPYLRDHYAQLAHDLALWPTPRGDYHHTLLVLLPDGIHDVLLYDRIRAMRYFQVPTAHPSQFDVVIARVNESCEEACTRDGGTCSSTSLDMLDDCAALAKAFAGDCKGCAFETGADLPARVVSDAPLTTAGHCLVTEGGTHDCSGRFRWTTRACGCKAYANTSDVGHDEL